MGFDNISLLRHISPRLTTIGYPMEELANTILSSLFDLIGGKSPKKRILKTEFVTGDTI